MPKRYASKQIAKFLLSAGFKKVSQKGSHAKFKNEKGIVTILPLGKKILPPGTVGGVLEKAKINKADLESFFS